MNSKMIYELLSYTSCSSNNCFASKVAGGISAELPKNASFITFLGSPLSSYPPAKRSSSSVAVCYKSQRRNEYEKKRGWEEEVEDIHGCSLLSLGGNLRPIKTY